MTAPPPMPPGAMPNAKPAVSNNWKLGAIAGVVVLGGLFGSVVAVSIFGGGARTTAAVSSSGSSAPSTFQDAFDASFKRSCRQSAVRSGNLSQSAADSYCDCALSAFHQTHSMVKAAGQCRQYVMR